MSFLAGRLAGKEAAYFFQESKHAVTRLAEKPLPTTAKNLPEPQTQADVLPEVLRHSLPSRIFGGQPQDPSSLSKASKWSLPSNQNVSSVSPDALNPLRAYLSLPQVTFGPKRWQLPKEQGSVLASTANERRTDTYSVPLNPEKLKAAAEGLQNIGKAFALATAIVFGGATFIFSTAASKLDVQNGDDVQTKVRDVVRPKLESIKEQAMPLKTWAKDMSKKWHMDRDEDIKKKPIVKELSKILGVKPSS